MKPLLRRLGEFLLADFRWYRRRAGGEWWLVRHNLHPAIETWERPRKLDPAYEEKVGSEVWR